MSSFEQANMLLRSGRDANDRIRDANDAATRQWETVTKPEDEAEKEGKAWYHGITDVGNVGAGLKSAYDVNKKMKALNVSYGELGAIEGRAVGNKIGSFTNATIDSVKGGISAAGEKVGSTIENIGAKSMGLSEGIDFGEEGFQAAASFKPTVAGGLAKGTESGGFVGVQSTADLTEDDLKAAKVNFGELDGKATSTIEDAGKLASEGAEGAAKEGGLVASGIAKVTGAEIGTLANVGIAKGIANVGGAVDLYKDFENIGKKGGFLGGTGASGMDEFSNALTIGGTALDIASLALPFLAPVAAAVQITGAGISTYESIKDSDTKESNDKGDYDKHQINYEVPPSLAGAGFLASTASDPHKMISGNVGAF